MLAPLVGLRVADHRSVQSANHGGAAQVQRKLDAADQKRQDPEFASQLPAAHQRRRLGRRERHILEFQARHGQKRDRASPRNGQFKAIVYRNCRAIAALSGPGYVQGATAIAARETASAAQRSSEGPEFTRLIRPSPLALEPRGQRSPGRAGASIPTPGRLSKSRTQAGSACSRTGSRRRRRYAGRDRGAGDDGRLGLVGAAREPHHRPDADSTMTSAASDPSSNAPRVASP